MFTNSNLRVNLACPFGLLRRFAPHPLPPPPPPPPKSPPDLSDAIEKRIEGKTEEAIELLRKYNEEFPDSPEILIQLGRSLHDSGQYALSAFRLEQALSGRSRPNSSHEVAQAHEKAGDEKSARALRRISRGQPGGHPSLACSGPPAARADMDTEALNAFGQAVELTNHEDCLLMAELFFEKNLLVQAEYWYRESARKEKVLLHALSSVSSGSSCRPRKKIKRKH